MKDNKELLDLKALECRVLYGKLFSALLSYFGGKYTENIEDAIQNAFYKWLKVQTANPKKLTTENWLFTVAKNDVLNQLKKAQRYIDMEEAGEGRADDKQEPVVDLRLHLLLKLAQIDRLSQQVKILFALKNIVGLSIKEICQSTLLQPDTVYKSIRRTQLQLEKNPQLFDEGHTPRPTPEKLDVVNEILYAIFSVGFDSFNTQPELIVDEDLCLDALALAKTLNAYASTAKASNLLALFCFNIARIPSRVKQGELIPFFEQNRSDWQPEFIRLGFHYLQKPKQLEPFYLEALIVSKHMTTPQFDQEHWQVIVRWYELLIAIRNSPVTRLNLTYALHKAGKQMAALELLNQLEENFLKDDFYFKTVKAELLREKEPKIALTLLKEVSGTAKQEIRRQFLSVKQASWDNQTKGVDERNSL